MVFNLARFMARIALMGLCATLFLSACGGGSNSGGGGSTPTPTPTPTPSTANEWTWMSGSSTDGARGVYGTLGVASILPIGRRVHSPARDEERTAPRLQPLGPGAALDAPLKGWNCSSVNDSLDGFV